MKKPEFRNIDARGDVPQQGVKVAAQPHTGLDAAQLGTDRTGNLAAGGDNRFADWQTRPQRPNHQIDCLRKELDEARDVFPCG